MKVYFLSWAKWIIGILEEFPNHLLRFGASSQKKGRLLQNSSGILIEFLIETQDGKATNFAH